MATFKAIQETAMNKLSMTRRAFVTSASAAGLVLAAYFASAASTASNSALRPKDTS